MNKKTNGTMLTPGMITSAMIQPGKPPREIRRTWFQTGIQPWPAGSPNSGNKRLSDQRYHTKNASPTSDQITEITTNAIEIVATGSGWPTSIGSTIGTFMSNLTPLIHCVSFQ